MIQIDCPLCGKRHELGVCAQIGGGPRKRETISLPRPIEIGAVPKSGRGFGDPAVRAKAKATREARKAAIA